MHSNIIATGVGDTANTLRRNPRRRPGEPQLGRHDLVGGVGAAQQVVHLVRRPTDRLPPCPPDLRRRRVVPGQEATDVIHHPPHEADTPERGLLAVVVVAHWSLPAVRLGG
jgi:hypothetical protein